MDYGDAISPANITFSIFDEISLRDNNLENLNVCMSLVVVLILNEINTSGHQCCSRFVRYTSQHLEPDMGPI